MPLALDPDGARVGAAVAEAFQSELGDRLGAFVVHGSAVTGYIAGFSDFDFVVFIRGGIELPARLSLAHRLHAIDLGPFAYLQLSRVVRVDDPSERMEGLIEGAFVVVSGALPPRWSLHTEAELRRRGRALIASIPSNIERLSMDWIDANVAQRQRLIRYLATDLKPALRALLAEFGEPTFEVWRWPYGELARRWSAYDAPAASRRRQLIDRLPPPHDQDAVARELFDLLAVIAAAAS